MLTRPTLEEEEKYLKAGESTICKLGHEGRYHRPPRRPGLALRSTGIGRV